MFLTTLPLDQSVGHILRHNIADAAGHKALPKGKRLTVEDVARLRALGIATVRVAVLEPGDVHEDEAAQRLANAVRRSWRGSNRCGAQSCQSAGRDRWRSRSGCQRVTGNQ